MPSFKRGDKVTHPRVSGELTVYSVPGNGMLTANDRDFSVCDEVRNFTLVQPPIRFGDRVRYVDQGDPDAVHIVIRRSDFKPNSYLVRYGLTADSYYLTEAEVLERRITEAGQ